MTVLPGLAVALELHGRTRLVEDGERLLLGRAERCDLVFDERCVSREHAWIKVRRGRATLTDQSSTGTWIVDRNGAHTTVRRESVQLHGSGTIRLGRHPHEPEAAPEIPFRIQRES
jgi:pSer/pThr/pTyr-binding forkhead associated (FHA) protein